MIRTLARTVSLGAAACTLATGLVVAGSAPADSATSAGGLRPWPGHPDRAILVHRVRRGDTPTGLAVRFHAWTDELVALNHLRRHPLRAGERVRVPVVLSHLPATTPVAPATAAAPPQRPALGGHWTRADLSRAEVAALIRRTARRVGVPTHLALAVAWQESGWQQRVVSDVGAIGVMQVLPSTGRWMRWYVGRPLHLRDSHDNVLAGVMTLRVLLDATHGDRRAIGAYYQGLGAVQAVGLYRSTRAYVRAVQAHRRMLDRTGSPV